MTMSCNTNDEEEVLLLGQEDPDNTRVFLNRSLTRTPAIIQAEGKRTLGWIGGVFAAVSLAQLSTNIFQRVDGYTCNLAWFY